MILSELSLLIAIRSEGFAPLLVICVPLIGFSSMPAFASLTLRQSRIASPTGHQVSLRFTLLTLVNTGR